MSRKKRLLVIWCITIFVAVIMSLLAMQRHHSFTTSTYDLGIEASVAWNTAHGRWFYDSTREINYLGDHFSPVYLLFAPIVWFVQPAIALLLIPSIAIACSLPPLALLAYRYCHSKIIVMLILIVFLCCPYLTYVNTYDFHPSALAIPLLLWIMYFFESKRWLFFTAGVILCFLLKEDIPFAIAGIGLYYILQGRQKLLSLSLIVISAAVFLGITMKIMPAFNDDFHGHLERYSHFGPILTDILKNTVFNHGKTIEIFSQDSRRLTTVFQVFKASGFFLFFAPAAVVAVMPSLLMHIMSNYPPQICLSHHYSASIIPFIFLGICAGIRQVRLILRKCRVLWMLQKVFFVGVLAAVIVTSLRTLPRYVAFKNHGTIAAGHAVLAQIPPDAAVAAAHYYVPHLIARRNIKALMPPVEQAASEAEYIVIDTCDSSLYPFSDKNFLLKNIKWLLLDSDFGLSYRCGSVILLKRDADRSTNEQLLSEICEHSCWKDCSESIK